MMFHDWTQYEVQFQAKRRMQQKKYEHVDSPAALEQVRVGWLYMQDPDISDNLIISVMSVEEEEEGWGFKLRKKEEGDFSRDI